MKKELILERLKHYKDTGEISSSNTAVVVASKYEIVTVNQENWIREIGAENWHSLEAMMKVKVE